MSTQFDALIASAALAAGVNPALVKAHMAAESNFDPRAYRAEPGIGDASFGLMQLLWRTARALGYTAAAPTDTDKANLTGLYDPATNIQLGAQLIAQNLALAGGDEYLETAIAAYNEGIGNAKADQAAGRPWRTTDPNYVRNVRAYMAQYASDFSGGQATATGDGMGSGGFSPALVSLALALLAGALTWWARKHFGGSA